MENVSVCSAIVLGRSSSDLARLTVFTRVETVTG